MLVSLEYGGGGGVKRGHLLKQGDIGSRDKGAEKDISFPSWERKREREKEKKNRNL